MAGFVQIVEFETSRIDDVRMLVEKYVAEQSSQPRSYTITATLTADQDHPNRYLNIVEFPSFEQAMENSDRPETSEMASRLQELCDSVTFHNLDIIETHEV